MTATERFHAYAPELLEAAQRNDPALLAIARRALTGTLPQELPLGWKHVPDPLFPATAWIGVVDVELKSPNWFMRDFRIRSGLRKKWNVALRRMVTRVERVASWEGCTQLGRVPKCHDRMRIQMVRFTPSVRNFLKDDENSAFCSKQACDALKDVGLIKDDRRELFTSAPLLQDVSPVTFDELDPKTGRLVPRAVHATLFILWPLALGDGLFSGDPSHAHRSTHAAPPRQVPPDDGRTEEGRTVPGVRRRAGARAVDV